MQDIFKTHNIFMPMEKKHFNNAFGKNLRLLRKQKGLTQVELANTLGCSQTMITTYENGRKKPAVDTLAKLADALGVSTDQLIGLNAQPKGKVKIKNPKLWKKFEQIDQLPDTDKRTVFRMIDGLLANNKKKNK
jgi:transcriptional regulator with XRE-family HTH domain